jgi:hypothetical protein
MSKTTQIPAQRPDAREGPGFYWVGTGYSFAPNKAKFRCSWAENADLAKKQSQSGRPERDCGLGPFDYAQDGFADFGSQIQSGGQGPDRQHIAPNKANFRPFWTKNKGQAKKQSQSKPIGPVLHGRGRSQPANPKYEARNSKQIRNPKVQMTKTCETKPIEASWERPRGRIRFVWGAGCGMLWAF